jgi:hypothetical protein
MAPHTFALYWARGCGLTPIRRCAILYRSRARATLPRVRDAIEGWRSAVGELGLLRSGMMYEHLGLALNLAQVGNGDGHQMVKTEDGMTTT